MRALAILLAFSTQWRRDCGRHGRRQPGVVGQSPTRARSSSTPRWRQPAIDEAQLRLGEMYWYGEGVAVDRPQADALFTRAAAGGNQAAVAALTLTQSPRTARPRHRLLDREVRRRRPPDRQVRLRRPGPSCRLEGQQGDQQRQPMRSMRGTRATKGFIANIADAHPAGKRIPADVLELMSEAEVQQAVAHLDQVYGATVAEAKGRALPFMAQRDAWHAATTAYVSESNKRGRTEQAVAQGRARNGRENELPGARAGAGSSGDAGALTGRRQRLLNA